MNHLDFITNELRQSKDLLESVLTDNAFITSIERAANAMFYAILTENKIIACGNGGSMSDAMHFAAELTGKLKDPRRPLPAVAISDASHITCVANDFGYDQVFARYIRAVGDENDLLLAISTSGNSANVIQAIKMAISRNMRVVLLTGNGGGEAAEYDVQTIIVPGRHDPGRIQEVHIKVIHILCGMVERMLK